MSELEKSASEAPEPGRFPLRAVAIGVLVLVAVLVVLVLLADSAEHLPFEYEGF